MRVDGDDARVRGTGLTTRRRWGAWANMKVGGRTHGGLLEVEGAPNAQQDGGWASGGRGGRGRRRTKAGGRSAVCCCDAVAGWRPQTKGERAARAVSAAQRLQGSSGGRHSGRCSVCRRAGARVGEANSPKLGGGSPTFSCPPPRRALERLLPRPTPARRARPARPQHHPPPIHGTPSSRCIARAPCRHGQDQKRRGRAHDLHGAVHAHARLGEFAC